MAVGKGDKEGEGRLMMLSVERKGRRSRDGRGKAITNRSNRASDLKPPSLASPL
jgi:hypothetical protein